jgi:hypothetical protein
MLANDGHCGNWVDLRSRINAGRPISTLAYGSSIVGSHGGCTHPVPGVCPAASCPHCCGLSCSQDRGWARSVFEEINSSWPHPDNALYSLGIPGGGLVDTLTSCLRDYVRQLRVDLFLLEFAVTGGSTGAFTNQLHSLIRMLVTDQQAAHVNPRPPCRIRARAVASSGWRYAVTPAAHSISCYLMLSHVISAGSSSAHSVRLVHLHGQLALSGCVWRLTQQHMHLVQAGGSLTRHPHPNLNGSHRACTSD